MILNDILLLVSCRKLWDCPCRKAPVVCLLTVLMVICMVLLVLARCRPVDLLVSLVRIGLIRGMRFVGNWCLKIRLEVVELRCLRRMRTSLVMVGLIVYVGVSIGDRMAFLVRRLCGAILRVVKRLVRRRSTVLCGVWKVVYGVPLVV